MTAVLFDEENRGKITTCVIAELDGVDDVHVPAKQLERKCRGLVSCRG